MKENLFIISGGLSFLDQKKRLEFFKNIDIDYVHNSRSWKDWLIWSLDDHYNIVKPKMAGQDYGTDYETWKIIFEKYLIKRNKNKLNIVAHSLGTIFIIKYLLENKLKVNNLHLVSPIISNDLQPANDPEHTATFTFDITKVKELNNKCKQIHLWHSTDDHSCHIKNSEYLSKHLPGSKFTKFKNRGHFHQSTFLELFDVLRMK